MQQFVKDYIIVFVAIFGITVPLYYAISPKESEKAHKYEYLTKNSDGIKTLLLGHSHFSRSFNTSVLGDSVYNAALEGRAIYYDVEIARNFFPLMNNLHTVIYPMHYSFDNAFYVWQSPDSRHTKNRIFDYKKNMPSPPKKEFRKDRLYDGLSLACFLDNFTFKRLANHNGNDSSIYYNDSLGFHPLYGIGDYNPPDRYAQGRKKEFTEQLTELAMLCKEYNIRLVVTTSPGSNSYLQYVTEDGINNLYEVIENVSSKYPIEYHNYLADTSFRSDSLYYDASHLNYEGATLFAKRVKEDFEL